ncbi:MAG: FAD-binding protein [Planctomycetia bacterium]|nr:FAD-binding protein [Planctomycetia bacterium]
MSKLDAFKSVLERAADAKALTWLGLGGPIEALARPQDQAQLLALLKVASQENVDVKMLGDGASVLVSDVGAPGLVLQLSAASFTELKVDGTRVRAGAGAKLGNLVTTATSAGLAGVEGLVGIPGTVGAALAINVSTSDATLGQYVESAKVATYQGEILELTRDDFLFGYRSSNLENVVILEATFRFEQDQPEELVKRMQKFWIVRKKKTSDLENLGYARMFKNPRGQSAAELIDQAGFRGAAVGAARVSMVDPNLVCAEKDCKSDDVKRLVTLIQTQARERIGVDLELEIVIW